MLRNFSGLSKLLSNMAIANFVYAASADENFFML